MRIYNKSVSAVALSCAVARQDSKNVVVWLDLAPQHTSIIKAIWATLVNNTSDDLGLRNDNQTVYVTGLHSRYTALKQGYATPLLTYGKAPEGYRIAGITPWGEIISSGVRSGALRLDGSAKSIPDADFEAAKAYALENVQRLSLPKDNARVSVVEPGNSKPVSVSAMVAQLARQAEDEDLAEWVGVEAEQSQGD